VYSAIGYLRVHVISIGAAILSMRVRLVAFAVLLAVSSAMLSQEYLAKCISGARAESADPATVSRINEACAGANRDSGTRGTASKMNKAETIRWLAQTPVSEAAAGALEFLIEGGLSQDAIEQLERFRKSPLLENRHAALATLAHYTDATNLTGDAVGLLVSGLIADDTDAQFGAIGILGMIAARGDDCARDIISALRRDELVMSVLQILPANGESA